MEHDACPLLFPFAIISHGCAITMAAVICLCVGVPIVAIAVSRFASIVRALPRSNDDFALF